MKKIIATFIVKKLGVAIKELNKKHIFDYDIHELESGQYKIKVYK
jgi:hypothetical protein